MKQDPKTAYRQFCRKAPPDFPVFMQDWYLDAVCAGEGAWHAAIAYKGGIVAAVWPYFLKKKWGLRYVSMPPLGKFMGPYFAADWRSLDHQKSLYDALYVQLPDNLVAFEQDFHYDIENWLPLFWRGFWQTTRYSYTLRLDQSRGDLWRGISRNYQRKIAHAEEKLIIRHDLPLSELYRVAMLSFERQRLPQPYSFEFLERLHDALQANGACMPFFATDESGAVHSAALLICDAKTAYYLIGGDDPALRKSGSGVLIQWAAILFAQQEWGLSEFDFEGSMIEAIEATRREFGARQKAYFRVGRDHSMLWKWAKRWKSKR